MMRAERDCLRVDRSMWCALDSLCHRLRIDWSWLCDKHDAMIWRSVVGRRPTYVDAVRLRATDAGLIPKRVIR